VGEERAPEFVSPLIRAVKADELLLPKFCLAAISDRNEPSDGQGQRGVLQSTME